ncbi:PAC2 family protein [Leucobacter sp. OLCALW19]|uniref:proteasome assembly chaperone family protein n=1 Tax=Leucobacter sp. OLCALW19 TaxID=1914915 RepID=UPI000C19D3E2|nr:PAC2 family protein [Leucobacter sp. OLCALW19]PII81440.1 PAC2 family protein [Leucobacter sp. OLCALW19]
MTDSIFSAEYAERRATVPKGLPLLVALRGISDAGGVVAQLEEYLWERTEPQEIVRFDADMLLDYRARRPVITFVEDHLVDYAPEELSLALAHDELGAPFLLLSGYEPDFRWEQFIDAVLLLVHEFEVSTTVWTHAIPMPVPHTRPIRATVSGSRDDLIEARSVWKPTTKLAASAGHVLEYRLHSLGEDVVGFAFLVPRYLANTENPDVLLAALDGIMAASGLILPTDEVREAARAFNVQVDTQIAENEESTEMVRNLEVRYDEYMEDQTTRSPLVSEDGSLPTADQLASELERFLREQRDPGAGGTAGGGAPGGPGLV